MSGILRSAATLGLVAVIGTSLLTGVDCLTEERIAAQERRVILEQLGQIVPPTHDNDLLQDRISFRSEQYFPRGQTVQAYRARSDGEPQAVVLRFRAVNGYSGDILLLAGINRDGSLRGVRVVSHRETPGLGDAIETGKSDWIDQFTGRSLTAPQAGRWAVRQDGGDFDQLTGATITPRAIVTAVRDALTYFEANRDFLFEAPAEPPAGEES